MLMVILAYFMDASDISDINGLVMFEEPAECISTKNFEVQKVLDTGDAIAREIIDSVDGHIFTSNLEVFILAGEDSHFYNNQVIKAPENTCARQVGTCKYQGHGVPKVIPVIAFK